MEGGGERREEVEGRVEERKGVADGAAGTRGNRERDVPQTVGNHREIYGRGRVRGKEDIWTGVCRGKGGYKAKENESVGGRKRKIFRTKFGERDFYNTIP